MKTVQAVAVFLAAYAARQPVAREARVAVGRANLFKAAFARSQDYETMIDRMRVREVTSVMRM